MRKPPPFCLEKKPLSTHRLSFSGPTSSKSTTQEVAGLGALDADRAGQEVRDRQVDIAHVVGRVVVLDEAAAGPVDGLDDEVVTEADPLDDRNLGMPAVVDLVVFIGRLA